MEMVRANGEWAAMLAETAAERDRLKAENETLRKMLAGCHETIEAQQKEIGWYVENRAEGSRLKAEVERLTRERDELKAKNEHLDAMVSVLLTPGGQTKVLSALMAEAARRANERLDAKGAPDAPA